MMYIIFLKKIIMSDVNKDELYKILDLVNLLNNRVINLLERVNKNSSNSKYQLPVINKTEVKKTQVKKHRGIILKKNVLRDYWSKESEWIQFIGYTDIDSAKRLYMIYNEYRKSLCLNNVKFPGFLRKYLHKEERLKLINYMYENCSHNVIYYYDMLLAIKKTQSKERRNKNVLLVMR